MFFFFVVLALIFLLIFGVDVVHGIFPEATAMAQQPGLTRNELIRRYFYEGCSQKAILCYLRVCNGIQFRNLGNRAMQQTLREDYGVHFSRHGVENMLRRLDPEGVAIRRPARRQRQRGNYWNEGPNSRWHVDGYDKLAPFGLIIHGCIDGFSRRMWLAVGSSNKDPQIVGRYFTGCVRQIRGLPDVVRADCGTETINMATIQTTLRRNHGDQNAGQRSFWFGTSTENTRIEGWWSFLRKHRSGFWISFFKSLIHRGLYTKADPCQREALRFCFMGLLQAELDWVARHWNQQRIRESLAPCPPGKPNELYFMPQLHGAMDRKFIVNLDELDQLEMQYTALQDLPCEVWCYDQCMQYLHAQGLQMPSTTIDALDLYINLCQIIRHN